MRRAALSAGGWALTLGGVALIIVLVGGDHRFSGAGRVLVAVAVGLGALVPVALGVSYMLVRRRNRGIEATGGRPAVSPGARALQTSLASVLDRVNESNDDALGLRRVVLTDRVELTAANIDEIDDPWEVLSFIWFVRPSQPANFGQSEQFGGLPAWVRDVVVLLDLRRDVQLRGTAVALSGAPGFYHHTSDRITEAAAHTRSVDLFDVLRAVQHGADGQDREALGQRLLDLLDDQQVWVGLFESSK